MAQMVPKFYAGNCWKADSDRGFFLVLEDMAVSNHSVAKISQGLTLDQLTWAFESLAQSISVCDTPTSFKKLLNLMWITCLIHLHCC